MERKRKSMKERC